MVSTLGCQFPAPFRETLKRNSGPIDLICRAQRWGADRERGARGAGRSDGLAAFHHPTARRDAFSVFRFLVGDARANPISRKVQ